MAAACFRSSLTAAVGDEVISEAGIGENSELKCRWIHFEKLPLPLQMRDGAEDGIKRVVEMFSEVFGEEAEDMIAVLLK